MKVYGGVEVQLHPFENSAIGIGEWSYPGRLIQGRGPEYPLNTMQSRNQSQSGCFGEEGNLLLLPGSEIFSRPVA